MLNSIENRIAEKKDRRKSMVCSYGSFSNHPPKDNNRRVLFGDVVLLDKIYVVNCIVEVLLLVVRV
jgi:hypothetical protein